MTWWNESVVPRLVDASLKGREIGEMRGQTCAGLSGRLLEIGFGGGLNVRWYPPAVRSVSAVEPSEVGWELSARRRARATVPIVREGLDGQDIALPDDSHDSALVTFSLCTIPDPVRALHEVGRIVRPGGAVHFLEHGLSPDASVARWQHRIDPVQSRLAGGCHLSRDIPALFAEAGFEVTDLSAQYLPGMKVPRAFGFGYQGVAHRG